jgi:hypothetical protein
VVEHRPPAARAFRDAGSVAAAGTTTEAQAYAFRLDGLAPGTHAFRLRQIDLDGTATRSEAVEATVRPTAPATLLAWPNPVTRGAATVTLTLRPDAADGPAPVTVALFDVLGRRVRTLHDGPMAATGEPVRLRLRAEGLASGVYLLRATGPGFRTVRRLTVVR